MEKSNEFGVQFIVRVENLYNANQLINFG